MKNLIDISKIHNCWIVYLLPGGKDNSTQKIETFQKNCKEHNIFGLGWSDDKITNKYKGKKLNEDNNVEKYSNDKDNQFRGDDSLRKNLEALSNIKENDLLITRLRNGNYYIGKVNKEAYFYSNDDIEFISWVCDVEEWHEFSEKDIPSDIYGRFSQRRHKTIQRINDTNDDSLRQKLLLIKAYIEKSKDKIIDIEIPKVSLNENNFTSTLNYMDLENLVYIYMLSKNPEYNLLPSECKISKIKYEFNLIHADNSRITCQVKNKEAVLYKDYLEDAKQNYNKIYLFSGIDIYDKNKSKDDITNELKNYNLENKIIIIDRTNLFNFFVNGPEEENKKSDEVKILLKLLLDKLKQYYTIDKNIFKEPNGWEQKGKRCRWKKYVYDQSEDYISLERSKSIIFSKQFNSLIKLRESPDLDYEKEIIKNWTNI